MLLLSRLQKGPNRLQMTAYSHIALKNFDFGVEHTKMGWLSYMKDYH